MKTDLPSFPPREWRNIQIDAPRYSYYMDPKLAGMDPHGDDVDPEALLRRIGPRGQRVLECGRRPRRDAAMHLCRGNNRSHCMPRAGMTRSRKSLFATLAVIGSGWNTMRASGTFAPFVSSPREDRGAWTCQLKTAALESGDAPSSEFMKPHVMCRWRTWRWARSVALLRTMGRKSAHGDEQWASCGWCGHRARVWG